MLTQEKKKKTANNWRTSTHKNKRLVYTYNHTKGGVLVV